MIWYIPPTLVYIKTTSMNIDALVNNLHVKMRFSFLNLFFLTTYLLHIQYITFTVLMLHLSLSFYCYCHNNETLPAGVIIQHDDMCDIAQLCCTNLWTILPQEVWHLLQTSIVSSFFCWPFAYPSFTVCARLCKNTIKYICNYSSCTHTRIVFFTSCLAG